MILTETLIILSVIGIFGIIIILARIYSAGRRKAPVTLADTDAKYRVAHLVVNLGWVDMDFECSTVCPILLGLMGIWQKRLG